MFFFSTDRVCFPTIFLEDQVPSLRISEFLKIDGRDMLQNFTTTLRKEIKFLRDKHVRERKSTSWFKAEKNSRKTSLVTSINQRRARVSPENSTTIESNETSDERRRSASLFSSAHDANAVSNEKLVTTAL